MLEHAVKTGKGGVSHPGRTPEFQIVRRASSGASPQLYRERSTILQSSSLPITITYLRQSFELFTSRVLVGD